MGAPLMSNMKKRNPLQIILVLWLPVVKTYIKNIYEKKIYENNWIKVW